MCARRRSNFLLAAKRKSPKRRRPPVCVPHRPGGRWGQPAVLGTGVGVDELASFYELRSNSIDELDDEVHVSFGTCTHPSSCAPRRSQQGWGAGSKTAAASQLRRVSVRAARCRRVGRDHSGEPSEAMARMGPVPTPF